MLDSLLYPAVSQTPQRQTSCTENKLSGSHIGECLPTLIFCTAKFQAAGYTFSNVGYVLLDPAESQHYRDIVYKEQTIPKHKSKLNTINMNSV